MITIEKISMRLIIATTLKLITEITTMLIMKFIMIIAMAKIIKTTMPSRMSML